jgi:hypothetical protein
MPLPPDALILPDSMDPTDRVDFLIVLNAAGGLLESGEGVSNYTLTVRSEGVALGLTISTGAWSPTTPDAQTIKFWLEVAAGNQSDIAFDAGVTLGLELTINTNSSPSRRRQRTFAVKVKQL